MCVTLLPMLCHPYTRVVRTLAIISEKGFEQSQDSSVFFFNIPDGATKLGHGYKQLHTLSDPVSFQGDGRQGIIVKSLTYDARVVLDNKFERCVSVEHHDANPNSTECLDMPVIILI